jgi:hypothetical protein
LFHQHCQLELRWALSENGIKDAIFSCGVRLQNRLLGWKFLSDDVHMNPPVKYIMPQYIMADATPQALRLSPLESGFFFLSMALARLFCASSENDAVRSLARLA